MAGMIEMSGLESFNTTVCESGSVMPPSRATPLSGSISDVMRPAMELPVASFSHQRAMLKVTSRASKSSPFDHFTPLRT